MNAIKKLIIFFLIISVMLTNVIEAYGQINDIANHWAKSEVNYMIEKGVVQGYPDGTFRPDNTVSKAEFYRIINQLFKFQIKSRILFSDVEKESWYYEEVQKAVGAKYITNSSENLLPKAFITREEVVRIIGVVFDLNYTPKEADIFTDKIEISENIKGYIGALKKLDLINGYPDGTFRPKAPITRAEVVKILYNAIITGELKVKESQSKNVDKEDDDDDIETVAVSGVTLDKETIEIIKGGDDFKLNAAIIPINADNQNVIWTIEDENVAIVQNGIVTPVDIGETIVTVTTQEGGFSDTCQVIVVEPPQSGDFAGGLGTIEDPFKIATAQQLHNVRNYLDKHFIQIADIDLATAPWNEGEGWEPIGEFTTDKRFTGSYDGNGFEINNLTINRNEMYQGLFGYVLNASLKNVKLDNVNITGGMWTASLAAFQNGGLISNCSSKGVINGTGNHGGLVGQSNGVENSALITECYTEGEVGILENAGNPYYIGGLVGRTNGSTVSKSYSSASVNGYNTVGGLIGLSFNSTIEQSYANGNITGNEILGGIAGYATGTIRDVYYYGTINGPEYGNIGGLVGKYSGLTLENGFCIAKKSIYNEYYPYYHYYGLYDSGLTVDEIYVASNYDNDYAYAGFYERTIDKLKELYTYKKFDFQNIWGHNAEENNGYPFLRWQGFEHVADFEGGAGTEEDPYLVATAEQLNKVRNYLDRHFVQIEDINIDAAPWNEEGGWKPIGTSDYTGQKPFIGSYNGDGYSITGLTINRPDNEYQGLFGYVGQGSTLTNIKLQNANIIGDESIGALAGYSLGEITTCSSINGNIHGTDSDVGGLIGEFFGEMVDCFATGVVRGDYSRVGGLVGSLNSGDSSSIINSYCEADVLGGDILQNTAEAYAVGGIVGYSCGYIENCHSTGDVYGNEEVGGLVGENYDGSILESYSTGNVVGLPNSDGDKCYYIGGLVGENSSGDIIGCEVRGNVTAYYSYAVGGLIGSNGGGSIISSGTDCNQVYGYEHAGGLIGRSYHCTISDSYAKTTVKGYEYIGGLIGYSENDTISESYTNCNIVATAPSSEYGGFIGGASNLTVSNSYSLSNVTGHAEVGGFLGYIGVGTNSISNCYVAGVVEKAYSTSYSLGNFIGAVYAVPNIINSYYDSDIAIQPDNGLGVPKTSEEMKDQTNYESWDFTDIWSIDESINNGYPYLVNNHIN